ncbi:rod shape-determining protein MreC [Thalassolituus maritimus]|nr:rod shape-determining protein MreC [Pseudomonadota bacterium]MEC8103472.1 rod shape-determining protein MreC [Pseudomonadota bacterium]MEC8524361.1 rod shape-determining protein MreC [Pseudomonadota bacterium]
MPAFQGQRVGLIAVFCLVLMWVDNQYSWLESVRYGVGYLIAPARQTAVVPLSIAEWMSENATLRRELLKENKILAARNLVLERKAQRMASLEAENMSLRELLSASDQVDDKVLVTSVTAVDPDPYTQQIIIDKGGRDGVFVGQPVLDAYGLLGQVIDVLPFSARVLMIADSNHAVPVQVNRNGVRAIATGTGALNELELIYVPNTADIKVGDMLVSSGLGERYPKGYPVATVSSIRNTPGESFATVKAEPTAKLDRSRHLLLVFTDEAGRVPPEQLWRNEG